MAAPALRLLAGRRALAAEQRCERRARARFPVAVHSRRRGETWCVARDLAPGGLLLETFEPLPLGERVLVQLCLPETERDVVIAAEVRRRGALGVCDVDGEPRRLSAMALRFTDDGHPLRRALAHPLGTRY